MRRARPSMLVREELAELLRGEHDNGTNVVSTLLDVVSRLVIQELLEAEQADVLGGRGRYERRVEESQGGAGARSRGGSARERAPSRCASRRCEDRPSRTARLS
jgi:hypothetical protein